ncbi:MAG: hypothetical protein U9R74_00200 [Pseudomonadota bacterium]|nr:hypothetical protein [Pseudomonadota bacterium]
MTKTPLFNPKSIASIVGLAVISSGSVLADTEVHDSGGDVTVLQTEKTGSFAEMEALLEERGWQAHRDAKGNLILEPGRDADADELDRLRDRLEKHGWRVERDTEGSLLLYPETETGESTVQPSVTLVSDTAPAADTGNLDRLAETLRQRGWQVERDEDGSLLLFPQGATPAPAAPPAETPAVDLDAIEEQLKERGWVTERDGEGNLVFSPAQTDAGSAADEAPTLPEESTELDMDAMAETLRESGWQVERDEDGSLLLYPPGATATPAPAEPPVETPTVDLDSIEEQLQQRGWETARDSEGNLVFSPTQSATAAQEAPTPQADSTELDMDGMAESLRQQGWQVERDADGSLLLFPRSEVSPPAADPDQIEPESTESGQGAGQEGEGSVPVEPNAGTPDTSLGPEATDTVGERTASETTAEGNESSDVAVVQVQDTPPVVKAVSSFTTIAALTPVCQFDRPESVSSGEIELPVDTWSEAHAITQDWVVERGDELAAVGKIRKINRVYLVSIVTDSAPHRLLNQLVIRTSDGGVLAVFGKDLAA